MMFTRVASINGYDFYIGIEPDHNTLYNIVPVGSAIPTGGYRNKSYIEKIKHITFPDINYDVVELN